MDFKELIAYKKSSKVVVEIGNSINYVINNTDKSEGKNNSK